jgi:hypothetical protein
LFAWGLLCFLESGPRLRFYVPVLVAVAVIGALAKFTFLITGLFTIGLLACDLILRRRNALAAGMAIGFALGFAAGWMLLSQNISGLSRYLSTSFRVTNGYNGAMALDSVNLAWVLVMALTALGAVIIRAAAFSSDGRRPRAGGRVLLFIWLASARRSVARPQTYLARARRSGSSTISTTGRDRSFKVTPPTAGR